MIQNKNQYLNIGVDTYFLKLVYFSYSTINELGELFINNL